MWLHAWTLFLVYTSALVEGSRPSLLCNVVESASKNNMSCQFPFILNGKTHYSCTTIQDDEGKHWCSTRVTGREIHIGSMGFWGHCSDECLKFRDLEQSAIDSQEGDFLDGSNFCIDCRHFRDCPWSSNLLNLVGSLDKDSSARKRFISFIRDQKCDGGPRNVCCKAGSRPLIVDTKSFDLENSSNQSLGNWKPRPEKNQCGTASNAFFIVGGEDAKIGDLPFMALLGYDSPTSCTELIYACGGALINKHYVVTAAHCITDSPSPIRDIVLGDHDVISDPDCTDKACAPKVQRFKAANVIVHEKWDRRKFTEGNDIALIRLDKPAILANEDSERSFLIPVCLPWKSLDPGRELSAGDTTVVAGWGQLTNNITSARNNYCSLRAASRTLQKLNLPISSFEECNAAYRLFEVNNTQQLCSGGEPQKDSCNADSGGPLIYKANEFSETPMFQVGIVSFGTRTCGVGKPGIYTRVSSFLDWIDQKLEP
uniref:Serine protease easter n=1 Tax=Lepeophtheirus salmonis TaxID=72036 RepID=C1BUU5_LEPSM|nr:Serine protease easter precursor [Lepeophtheirus salmonis]